jgi:hypothetical protein
VEEAKPLRLTGDPGLARRTAGREREADLESDRRGEGDQTQPVGERAPWHHEAEGAGQDGEGRGCDHRPRMPDAPSEGGQQPQGDHHGSQQMAQ